MTTQQMITAIINAIQTDVNLILLVRASVSKSLLTITDTAQLQNACIVLGIDYTNPPSL